MTLTEEHWTNGTRTRQVKEARQKKFDIQPDYIVESGVKFEFTGSLLIPAPGEAERLAAALKPEQPIETKQIITATMGVHTLGRPDPPTQNGVVTHFAVRRVKMEPRDFLRLRG